MTHGGRSYKGRTAKVVTRLYLSTCHTALAAESTTYKIFSLPNFIFVGLLSNDGRLSGLNIASASSRLAYFSIRVYFSKSYTSTENRGHCIPQKASCVLFVSDPYVYKEMFIMLIIRILCDTHRAFGISNKPTRRQA